MDRTRLGPNSGIIPQTLCEWVKQAEKDSGMQVGATNEERDRIKALERENRALRQASEIFRKASASFAQADSHVSFGATVTGSSG